MYYNGYSIKRYDNTWDRLYLVLEITTNILGYTKPWIYMVIWISTKNDVDMDMNMD